MDTDKEEAGTGDAILYLFGREKGNVPFYPFRHPDRDDHALQELGV